jgi:hypothetical protein
MFFLNNPSVVEVLCDHLSRSFNYLKILTMYQNIGLALQNPPKTNSKTCLTHHCQIADIVL